MAFVTSVSCRLRVFVCLLAAGGSSGRRSVVDSLAPLLSASAPQDASLEADDFVIARRTFFFFFFFSSGSPF